VTKPIPLEAKTKIEYAFMKTNTKSAHTGKNDNGQLNRVIAGFGRGRLSLALVAVGLVLATPVANAAATVATADRDFILAAAQGGMTEVTLGELAIQYGLREDVKTFGQMMVKDHTAINDDLKVLAAQKGIILPDGLDSKHQEMVHKMKALAGIKFDNAYMADMKKDHKMDAKEFKAESSETKDVDIKNFVDKALPVVEAHFAHLTAMKKEAVAGTK